MSLELGIAQTTQTVTGVVLIAVQSVLTGVLAILIAVNAIIICCKENPHRKRRKEAEKLNRDIDNLTPLDARNSLLVAPLKLSTTKSDDSLSSELKLPVLQNQDSFQPLQNQNTLDGSANQPLQRQGTFSSFTSQPPQRQGTFNSFTSQAPQRQGTFNSFTSQPPQRQNTFNSFTSQPSVSHGSGLGAGRAPVPFRAMPPRSSPPSREGLMQNAAPLSGALGSSPLQFGPYPGRPVNGPPRYGGQQPPNGTGYSGYRGLAY